jgi:hypothetical protein
MGLIKDKVSLFGEAIAKVTPACLMLMVQGDVLALALAHWLTALKTAGIVGVILILLSLSSKTKAVRDNPYSMAGMVALVTTLTDFNTHASHYSGITTEALMTGMATGMLWLLVSFTPLGSTAKKG